MWPGTPRGANRDRARCGDVGRGRDECNQWRKIAHFRAQIQRVAENRTSWVLKRLQNVSTTATHFKMHVLPPQDDAAEGTASNSTWTRRMPHRADGRHASRAALTQPRWPRHCAMPTAPALAQHHQRRPGYHRDSRGNTRWHQHPRRSAKCRARDCARYNRVPQYECAHEDE